MATMTTITASPRRSRGVRVLVASAVLFVAGNLPVRKMAGELSEGMLFAIGYADGLTPVLAVPEGRVPNGTRAG